MATGGRLYGKTIVVTGGGSGIGAESCRLFASQGAKLVVADRDASGAEGVVDELLGEGAEAIAVAVDVTNSSDNESMVAAALERFDRVDGIFVNAGIAGSGAAHDISESDWHRVLSVNLTGAFFSARAALPVMLDHGSGAIVFQASICATNGISNTVAYSAAKGGVIGLMQQMSVEYASRGIRINSLSPGATLTPLVAEMYEKRAQGRGTSTQDELDRTAASYPMQRLGTTREIANAALFLLSDEASFITGTNLSVDGGFTTS